MATIFKRKWKNKTTYRCTVRRKGFKTLIKSFNTRGEATKWGRSKNYKHLLEINIIF